MPGPIQAKNRAPAPIQITAEQLLREAKERGLEDVQKQPKQFITDKEELLQYQNAKRKDFEDQIRRNRHHIGIWCRYALWEAASKEFERSRSVFERALSEYWFLSLSSEVQLPIYRCFTVDIDHLFTAHLTYQAQFITFCRDVVISFNAR